MGCLGGEVAKHERPRVNYLTRIWPSMFAVSRCPSCRRLHGLELPLTTTTCRLCGKRYTPSSISALKTFSTDAEMRAFLQGAASIEGGSETPIIDEDAPNRTNISPSESRPGRSRVMKMVLLELRGGPRSWADLSHISQEGAGPEMLEECLVSLMEQGSIYQMTDGRYSLVE
jgi:hypothetical protein